jgi:hypothetical protein
VDKGIAKEYAVIDNLNKVVALDYKEIAGPAPKETFEVVDSDDEWEDLYADETTTVHRPSYSEVVTAKREYAVDERGEVSGASSRLW